MSITGQLFLPPLVPHAWDDEFDGFTLDAKWTVRGSLVVPAPALNAAVTGSDIRIAVGQRESWIRLQSGSGASINGIRWSPNGPGVELPDGTYWARYAPRWKFPAIGNDSRLYFVLERDAGGNYFGLGIELDANEVARTFAVVENSVSIVNLESTDLETRGEMHEYLAFTKVGTTITGWSGNAAGQWMRHGSRAYAGPGVIDSIGLQVINNTSTDPGSMIQSVDFIRYRADGELP